MKAAVFMGIAGIGLALVQTSFFPHFSFFGIVPPVALLALVVFNCIESFEVRRGLALALGAGFALDVFSSHVFGFWLCIFVGVAWATKFVMHYYVRTPILQKPQPF